jgi:outer membrane biosynthesis protein TonB
MRYHVNFGKQSGIAQVYAVGSQIYIVAAWGAARASASVEEFIRSFTLNLPVPMGSSNAHSGGIGDGSVKEPGSTVYSRIYFASEVTQKAQVLKKPEPVFTEGAREFGVTGKVRVRLILWPSGVVSNIRPISFLPHGLTWEAMEAARRIKFTPAMKDGRAVPQYATFEYNFNIY